MCKEGGGGLPLIDFPNVNEDNRASVRSVRQSLSFAGGSMSREHIDHRDLAVFGETHVNLKREVASKYREQVNNLRKRLEQRLKEDPEFRLRRMLLSGSLAKGTALRSLNDIDVALYILQEDRPTDKRAFKEFIDWLANTLRELYPNIEPSQIRPQKHSVRISFRNGLDVDIVPIAYDGNQEWDGYLYTVGTDRWLKTNIPKQLEFIRKRKRAHPQHFAQVVRFLKYWIKEIKKRDESFTFKSFLVELTLAYLADRNEIKIDDYVEALAGYFNFIVTGGLDGIIAFDDYYQRDEVHDDNKPMRIFDPVNPGNNASGTYTSVNKAAIVREASEAADAVDAALYATTKSETIRYWQKIFGPSFGG